MLKTLLSFVGEQDPISNKTNEEGSIVTLCRQIKPDLVYLIPTAAGLDIKSSTEENAEFTRDWIKDCKDEINPDVQVYIRPIMLPDPTDYMEILPKARQQLGEILKELSEREVELHINCSSGTPQLKSTWIILANSGLFSNYHLWQVGNPLHCTERVKKLEITFMEEENILLRIQRYVDEFLFQRIAEECENLKRISCYSYRKEKAELLQRIFSAYQSWDLIRYNDAYQRLNSVLNDINRARDLEEQKSVLESQVAFLDKLRGYDAGENEYNLLDLYFNAQRRLERGDYTDTLSRFWRVYEGTLYYYLRKHYNIEPTELARSGSSANLSEIRASQVTHNPSKLGLRDAEIVLEQVFKDSKYKKMETIKVKVKRGPSYQNISLLRIMDELRKRRNSSIVAHGMRPVDEDDAVNSMIAMEAIFQNFFSDVRLDDFPLSKNNMRVVLSALEKTYSLS